MAFNRIAKFRARRIAVSLRAQLLKHSFPPKKVNERPVPGGQLSTQHREIFPHWGMAEKLQNERISIPLSLRKEQNPGGEAIDAMYHKRALPLLLEFCGKQGQRRFSSRTFDRHRGQSSRFIEDHHRIVFIEHGKLAVESRPPRVGADR